MCTFCPLFEPHAILVHIWSRFLKASSGSLSVSFRTAFDPLYLFTRLSFFNFIFVSRPAPDPLPVRFRLGAGGRFLSSATITAPSEEKILRRLRKGKVAEIRNCAHHLRLFSVGGVAAVGCEPASADLTTLFNQFAVPHLLL